MRGIVVIMDLKDLGMKQLQCFTPSFAKKLTFFVQEALPLRLKEFHVVNNPAIFKIGWQIVKPLLNEKFSNRVGTNRICSNFEINFDSVTVTFPSEGDGVSASVFRSGIST